MPETISLVRLSLTRNRWPIFWMVGAVVIGLVTALSIGSVDPQDRGGIAVVALVLSMVPSALAAIALFEYGQAGDMNLPESGCSQWVLRMPIRAWKIAVVPITLKTLWLGGLWILLVLVTRRLGANEQLPLLMPCISFAAAAVWVLVISWRPFRSAWRRLAALLVVAPILYLGIAAVFAAPHINQVEWRPIAVIASRALAILLYAAGVIAAIQSVKLARVNVLGIVPDSARNFAGIVSASDGDPARRFGSAREAIFYHEYIKSRYWVRKTLLILGLPLTLALALLVPLNGITVGMAFLAYAYLGGIAISRDSDPPEGWQTVSPQLAPYLAASPLRNSTIAWSRFLTPLAIAAAVYSCVFFVFAAWACRPDYRAEWMQWANERAASLSGAADPLITGLRWSAAIILAWPVFFLGRLGAYLWTAMTGRSWLGAVAAIVGSLGVLIPCGVALRWFLQQTDWETTRTSALSYWAMAPAVLGSLLLLKTIATATCGYAVVKLHADSSLGVLRVIAIWMLITLSVAAAITLLVPDPRLTFLWSVAATALVIPLARVVILPLAVAWNRHR